MFKFGFGFSFSPDTADVPYLLDTYPFHAGYSVRQLNSAATNCMRIRRASDNAELDIGFVSGWVDTAAIATFCSGTTGYVVTWYDQSGNGYDATQTIASRQMKIYESGSVFYDNGIIAIRGGSGTVLEVTSAGVQAQPNTYFGVCQFNSPSIQSYLIGYEGSPQQNIWTRANEYRLGTSVDSIVDLTDREDIQGLVAGIHNTSSSSLRWNGAEVATGTIANQNNEAFYLGNLQLSTNFVRPVTYLQEFIMYNDDQSANFTAIETDINTAFGIY